MKSLDLKFWDFDNFWILIFQALNVRRAKGIVFAIAWILKLVNKVINLACNPTLICLLLLVGQMLGYDVICRAGCHALVQTFIISSFFKRMWFRKRPYMCMPNRAFADDKTPRSSSLVSQTLLIGSLASYIFYPQLWISISTFIALSILKIISGSIYPSDAIFTIPIFVFNHLLFIGVQIWVDYLVDKPANQIIFRNNFTDLKINKLRISYFLIIFTFSFLVSMIKPIQLWKKTPLMMTIPVSIWVLNVCLLFPNDINNYSDT